MISLQQFSTSLYMYVHNNGDRWRYHFNRKFQFDKLDSPAQKLDIQIKIPDSSLPFRWPLLLEKTYIEHNIQYEQLSATY